MYKLVWRFQELFAVITILPELGIKHKFTVGWNKRSDFCEPKQQQKQQKTMEVKEAGLDSYDKGFIHQFQPASIHKI